MRVEGDRLLLFVGEPKTLVQDGNRTVIARVVDLEAMGLRGHGPQG
ncbi:hypothetical protein [Kitasatospora sp. NBC_01302]|nr:hypothetical protein OG294_40770 [Kitasatospora sp. NBC_01302]